MPNSTSAKKRLRQTERKTTVNRARISRVRTYVRKVEEAIQSGDATAAKAALTIAEPELIRGAQKGVLHRNTAQRKVSRLTQQIRKMST